MQTPPLIVAADETIGSYSVAGERYADGLRRAGYGATVVPRGNLAALTLPSGAVVIQTTIGPRLLPLPGVRNVAVVFHEWSAFPEPWRTTLDRFDEVWAPTSHVRETLASGGLATPLHLVPPPLTEGGPLPERAYGIDGPPRLLAVGEPHFRKGFHLLMAGFMTAFAEGEARLTIKTSPGCSWHPPRSDIRIVAGHLSREELTSLYDRHDAFVTASLGEGLGMPLAEAIDRGTPVAANRWGGQADLLDPEGGWVIPHEAIPQPYCSDPAWYAPGQQCGYSSPEAIAATLRELVSATADERRQRARSAHGRLVERFGLDSAAPALARRVALLLDAANDSGVFKGR